MNIYLSVCIQKAHEDVERRVDVITEINTTFAMKVSF